MDDRLATIDMDGKLRGSCPLFAGAGVTRTPSNTISSGPRPTSIPSSILIHAAIWPQRTWAKDWGTVPLFGEGNWVPIWHNVAGAEAYMSSLILIRPTVWPQYTNVTDRQTNRTDRQTGQDRTGQRFDSIERTVLQSVAQKLWYVLLKLQDETQRRLDYQRTYLCDFLGNMYRCRQVEIDRYIDW